MSEKALLFIDMDGVLVDFYGAVRRRHPEFDQLERPAQRKITAALSAETGFFTALKPIPGAIAAFKKLAEAYDVYILSTPDWDGVNSWTEKRIWIGEHLGEAAYKRLILSHNKGLFSGRALVDDRKRNGVEHFKGEHIHFGTAAFPDWAAVLAYLLPATTQAHRADRSDGRSPTESMHR